MGFLSVLGKIGKAAWFGLQVAQPSLSQIGAATPGPDPYDQISGVILDAEAIGEIVKAQGGTPLDKFNNALPLVKEAILRAEQRAGNELADETLFTSGAGKIVNGMVEVKKAFKKKD